MSYKFFQNKDCEYFPCHKQDPEKINCLFCFCPLYTLGDKCGGKYMILPNGVKDCSQCLLPHTNYDYIIQKLIEVNQGAKIDEK